MSSATKKPSFKEVMHGIFSILSLSVFVLVTILILVYGVQFAYIAVNPWQVIPILDRIMYIGAALVLVAVGVLILSMWSIIIKRSIIKLMHRLISAGLHAIVAKSSSNPGDTPSFDDLVKGKYH